MKSTPLGSPLVGIITGFGINADTELALAFEMAGARVIQVHLSDLFENPTLLKSWQIAAFPGGFSFGDHLGSGQVLAHQVRVRLGQEIQQLLDRDGLVLGICNGFQTLVKSGLLPNTNGQGEPQVSLIHNSQGSFLDTWVKLELDPKNTSPWLRGFRDRESSETTEGTRAPIQLEYPIRHGEGRFIFGQEEVRNSIIEHNQVAFRYLTNPNGSQDDIAGITDKTGNILGLMPHPEAFLTPYRHPRWTREPVKEPTWGLQLFLNGVRFFQ